jgi:demethylmenaquinone methyltransferase/2-methoxy-6-polyprenyl-1,4-benzoquinol methylase
MPLRDAFETPETKRRYVRGLFATIADRYDLITVLLSGGRDRHWKERLVRMAGVQPGTRALDLACGTGDIAFALAGRGAQVTGLDITYRMLQLATQKRSAGSPVAFLAGDMTALPFAGGSFDVVTTGYGLRNVPRLDVALSEIHRVLRPGGLLLSLDFNRPEPAIVRAVYLTYLTVVGSALGLALHRDPDTYRYIPESIKRYPGARGLRHLLAQAGFTSNDYLPVLGGLMAIHRATRSR